MKLMSFTSLKIECNLVKNIQKVQSTIEYHINGAVRIKAHRIAPSKCKAQLLMVNLATKDYPTTNVGITVAEVEVSASAGQFSSV